jgi:hypothetical protein
VITPVKIKWSFSGLKDFINCPRQYHEVKVLGNFAKKATQHMAYGTDVHQALEDYVKQGITLPKNYQQFKAMVDPLVEMPGEKYPEYKMALTGDKIPCTFDGPDYWVRGIVDLLVIDGDTAYIVDYKTGSNRYPDPKQLKLMALMTFAHFPEVEFIKAGLLFVVHNSFLSEEYSRDEADKLWGAFTPDLMRLEQALSTGHWGAKHGPLCGWCPVQSCDFYKPRR